MKLHLFKMSIVSISVAILASLHVNAASLYLESPEKALATGKPVVVQVFLDPEGETISGIAGNFSFPTDMFSVADISTDRGVVSLWAQQPSISNEKYLDSRTHIVFEGIFPGGFDGVRSPYYQGKKPGIIFSVTLLPKNKGNNFFIVDDLVLNRFDSEATSIPVESVVKRISVPEQLTPFTQTEPLPPRRVKSPTLTAVIGQDSLIANNALHLIIDERNLKSAIREMFVAETDDYNAEMVDDHFWRKAKNPYILTYQNRTKFIHIKVIYSDGTYTTISLSPVENFQSILNISRILVSVIIVLSLLYFYYGRSPNIPCKKKEE